MFFIVASRNKNTSNSIFIQNSNIKFFLTCFCLSLCQEYLGAYSFLVFTAIIITFAVFFWLKLPETKNRSFDEIYRILGILPPANIDDDKVTN